MMRILIVAPFPPPYGGIANWTQMIMKAFHENPDIKLEKLDISPKISESEGRTIKNRVIDSGIQLINDRKKLKKILTNNKIDIMHLTTSGQLALIRDLVFIRLCNRYKIPVVYHIRFGRIPECKANNSIEWKMLNKICKLCNIIITIDKNTYGLLKGEQLPVVQIPNPVKTKTITNIVCDKKICFLGWVIKSKGIEELIMAWGMISNYYPGWILEIIGPYSKQYMIELLKKYDMKNISFKGEKQHSEALQLISKCSVFVLPSYTEGFPNAILEAMELGKPIIATDVGAIKEMLDPDCGIVIEPKNVESLKSAIENVLSDDRLRERYGRNARDKVRNNYDLNIIINKYINLWNNLI